MTETLRDLGLKYNTDKADTYRVGSKGKQLGHNYLKYYELFLENMRYDDFTVVEMGCFTGASLKMWKEYFPHAQIIGIDLNEKLVSLEEERIKFICSDATSPDLVKVLSDCSNNIRLIIDDCSHAWADQRISFEQLFPILAGGGYYIIEDLECGAAGAYPNYPPKILDAQLFWDYAMDRMKILRVSEKRGQTSYRAFFSQLPEHIQKLELSIDMAIVVPGSIIFRKK